MEQDVAWGRYVRGVLTTACLLALSARLCCAQRLRGRVLDSDGLRPASLVGVVVRDSLGRTVWQGQTTMTGSFVTELPAAGRFTVTLLRVGFIPTHSDPIMVAPFGEGHVELRLSGAQVSLPVVSVRSKARCPTDSRTGGPLADAWEQARAGLLVVEDRNHATSPRLEVVSYSVVQQLLPRAETLIVVSDNRAQYGESFRSRTTRVLLSDGFVVERGDSIEYEAPDQRVLLDPEFIAHYCLWLEPTPAGDTGLIGIGLRPAQSSRPKRGIDGVLWVRRDGSLVRFDFHYLNMTEVLAAARPGGSLRFRRLADGRWIVSSWEIRMPQAVIERRANPAWRDTPLAMIPRLQRIVTVGGVTTRVASADGQLTPVGAVNVGVQVRSDGDAQRLVGSTVRRAVDSMTWTVPESLQLPQQSLVPGNHRFLVQSPLMRDAGLEAVEVRVLVLPDSQFGPPFLRVPSVATVRRMLCGADDGNRSRAAAFGTLPASLLPRDSMSSLALIEDAHDRERRGRVRAEHTVRVSPDGHWVSCGLPVDVSLLLSLQHHGHRLEIQRFRISKGVDLAAVSSPSEQSWIVSEPSVLDMPSAGALHLQVRAESSGFVLTDADVRIDDTLRVRFVVEAGEYRLHGLSSGVHRLSVRRMGYSPLEKAIVLSNGASVVDSIHLMRNVTKLAEVVINGRKVAYPARFAGVVERTRTYSGALFTRDDLRPVGDVKSLLALLPGVRVNNRGVSFARCEAPLPSRFSAEGARNFVQVYIDGVRVTAMPDSNAVEGALRLVSSSAVEFIEVYSGVARIPAEWQYDACAVIALWTKRW